MIGIVVCTARGRNDDGRTPTDGGRCPSDLTARDMIVYTRLKTGVVRTVTTSDKPGDLASLTGLNISGIQMFKQQSLTTHRTSSVFVLSILLGLLLTFGTQLFAQQDQDAPNTLTPEEKQNGWQLLFNGKSLKGWKSWKTKKPVESGSWQVMNGTLALAEPGGGDIYTARSFEDFIFKIEFRTTGNSGIFFRVNPDYERSIWHYAPEIQVLNDGPTDTGTHDAGALYDLYAFPTDEKTMHTDGWNQVIIKIEDNQYTHWFNGQRVTKVKIGGKDWTKRVKNSKFDMKKFGQKENGHFGLQDHNNKVQFRNIKVKPLD